MKQLVIMPGGFHPFHAGHLALYQSAEQAFPGADVKVAATNDTSARPFPFKLKEKLAQLAGVPPGKFYQVKSPFRADEITKSYDPADTQLIFVRSEKDADKPPVAGGIKKDGAPAYLQPISDDMAPMTQHAYMVYLPTVEFGPGMTSATEIRSAWPTLNPKRKTALVMSLYPETQSNPKLAANVVDMLDTAMGAEAQGVAEGVPLKEQINYETLKRFFNKQKDMGWYILSAHGDWASRPADELPTMEIFAELKPEPGKRNGEKIGQLSLKIAKGQFLRNNPGAEALVASGVEVEPAYERKGVGTSMYQFARELGNDVIASIDQSDDAKALWASMRAKGVAEGALDEGVNDPHIFKAIAMIGPMGAGKSTIARQLVGGSGLRSLNLDNFNELLIKKGKVAGGNLTPDQLERSWQLTQAQKGNWVAERLGLLIDGSGRNVEGLVKPLTELEKLGYDTMVILVNVSLETSLQRQQTRAAQQTAQYGAGRNVPLDLAKSSYEQIQQNIPKLQQLYGNRLLIINNERAVDLSQEQSIVSKFLNSPPSSPAAVQWIKSHGQSQGQQLDNRLAQQQRQAASAQRAPAYKSNAKSAVEVVDEASDQAAVDALIKKHGWSMGRTVNGDLAFTWQGSKYVFYGERMRITLPDDRSISVVWGQKPDWQGRGTNELSFAQAVQKKLLTFDLPIWQALDRGQLTDSQAIQKFKAENERQAREAIAQGVNEASNQTNDSELNAIKTYAKRHYPNLAADPESAFDKWVQRSLMHSNVDDHEMDQKIRRMAAEIAGLKTKIQSLKQQANDYLDESR
jgi:adenylate kinase family enzyme/GNAT superfamily N-acetyltransferase